MNFVRSIFKLQETFKIRLCLFSILASLRVLFRTYIEMLEENIQNRTGIGRFAANTSGIYICIFLTAPRLRYFRPIHEPLSV